MLPDRYFLHSILILFVSAIAFAENWYINNGEAYTPTAPEQLNMVRAIGVAGDREEALTLCRYEAALTSLEERANQFSCLPCPNGSEPPKLLNIDITTIETEDEECSPEIVGGKQVHKCTCVAKGSGTITCSAC